MTSTYHPMRCRCGALQGRVALRGISNHVICYCKDCQAFARFLGHADEVLDAQGGSEIVQVMPDRVQITQGQAQLAAMRLSPRGLLRWYTACCRTPLGNTLPSGKLPFVGLLHSSLKTAPLEPSFGPVRGQFNTASAIGEPRPHEGRILPAALRIVAMMGACRLTGRYRHTPFFTEANAPVVQPTVLTANEREHLRREPGTAQED
jgi:hypothetical protein